MFKLYFGMDLVNCVRAQRQNSTSFAQASSSRLSESCRTSFLVFGSHCSLRQPMSVLSDKYSRLGEPFSPKRGRDETCTS